MDARDAARAVDDFARWLRGCQSRVVTDTGLQLQCSLPDKHIYRCETTVDGIEYSWERPYSMGEDINGLNFRAIKRFAITATKERGTYYNPTACTLVRRAELSSTALVAQRPELAPRKCASCGRNPDTEGHSHDCPAVIRTSVCGNTIVLEVPQDDRPLLGHDRHGREVRRGDRGFNVAAAKLGVFAVHSVADGEFHSADHMRQVAPSAFELITDEKAEQDEPGIVASRPTGTPESRALVTDITAIESFVRWLAAPTLADSYAAFRSTVESVIAKSCAGLDVEAVTDNCNGGFLLRVRIGSNWFKPWFSYGYTEEVMREWFRITLDAYARELGRKALAK